MHVWTMLVVVCKFSAKQSVNVSVFEWHSNSIRQRIILTIPSEYRVFMPHHAYMGTKQKHLSYLHCNLISVRWDEYVTQLKIVCIFVMLSCSSCVIARISFHLILDRTPFRAPVDRSTFEICTELHPKNT